MGKNSITSRGSEVELNKINLLRLMCFQFTYDTKITTTGCKRVFWAAIINFMGHSIWIVYVQWVVHIFFYRMAFKSLVNYIK